MLYSTGSYHLLSAALTQASGRSTLALARDWLGEPLGIDIPPWTRDPQGFYLGGNNMMLSPRALLRFGEMYREGGAWRGAQVLPQAWVEASWTPRTSSFFTGHAYGYGWFIVQARGHPVAYAWGYGGQMIYVVPDLGLTRRRSPRTRTRRRAAAAMCGSCTGCSPTPSSRPPSKPELWPRVRRAAACPARALRLCRAGPCAAMRGTSRRDLRRQRGAGGSEEASMRYIPGLMAMTAALALTSLAMAAEVPGSPDQVAEPGGSLPGDPKIALVKVADGFSDPINVANAGDGSGRIFVVERVGRIKVVNADGSVQEDPFLDLTTINPLGNDVQTGFVEQGLYAVAFHPNFAENGYFFVHYASLPFNGDGMIVRFQVDPASPDVMTPERTNETAKVIMRIEQPWYNHNGGQIEFGPDGYLYIGSGDGGWEGDPYEAGQDLSTWLGKILRIDVDVPDDADRPYAIPDDNPFANASRRAADGAVRHHRGGVRHDQDALQARDLGLWRAQPLRVRLRSADGRSVHRRRRPEPLGGDHLAAGGQRRRRELRLGTAWRRRSAIR